MITGSQRARISFGLALILHALVLSSYLPEAIEYAENLVRTRLQPAPPPEPERQIIPVSLPSGNFQLQHQLGSLKKPPKDPLKPDQLPRFQPKLATTLSMSASLGDAAAEAARAESAARRMSAQAAAQTRIQEEFVADIILAASPVVVASAPASKSALALEEQQKLAELAASPSAAADKTPEPVSPPPPAAEKPRNAKTPPKSSPPKPASPPAKAAEKKPAKEPVRVARSEPNPEPKPEPARREEPPSPPAELPPLERWEPDLPPPRTAQIPPAREDQPLAALFIPGMEPAPDRGPGEFTEGAAVYFSKLTAHLFRVNQKTLANSVKAGSKVTMDVRFYIDRSGRILGSQVVRSSGDADLDQRAEQVILDASPVPQLADDMPQKRLELSFPVDVYR